MALGIKETCQNQRAGGACVTRGTDRSGESRERSIPRSSRSGTDGRGSRDETWGEASIPTSFFQKEWTAAGPGLWKECLVRVGTAGEANLEAVGRCWTVPGSFPLHCSLPEIYF